MALFRRNRTININPLTQEDIASKRAKVPDNLAEKCPHCGRILLANQITKEYLCPHCAYHLHFPARERIEWLVDDGSFKEFDSQLQLKNPLEFPGYTDKLNITQTTYDLDEAVVSGSATISQLPVALAVMDKRFFMASMGSNVGEKLTRLFEYATQAKLPVILYIASGGARMQEGILSLMQMAKVSQAVQAHSEAGLFYGAILTHPTTGGVTASFAMQADIIMAEPLAIIGFAGKRVIEQTIKSKLPDSFQEAEWVYDNGFVDIILSRPEQKQVIHQLIDAHSGERK